MEVIIDVLHNNALGPDYSGTSLIRTPKIPAPPSNGQLLNSKLDQIRVG